MMPNSNLGGYGALVIKSPKHSTSLSVLATADGAAAPVGPDNGGGQVQGNGGHTVESRKKTAATKRVLTTLVAHHPAVKATHVAKKATKAVATRNGNVDLKIPPPPPPPPVIIDSDRVSGMTPMDIDFTPNQLTALTVSPGNLRVNVRGTPNQGPVGSVVTTLTKFRGALTVGDGLGHLSRVQGALDVTNPTGPISSLIVDGSTEPGKQSATISPGVISGLAPAKITYPALDVTVIHLLGGTGGNTFHVVGTAPRVPVTIDGGSGANKLIGPNLTRTWNITARDAGNVNNVTFQRVGNLTGGRGADTFALSDGASLSGGVDGGKGLNTLDMSAQNRDIVVNLAMGTATAIDGRVVNIASAIGGNASSILVGNGTTNSLKGGAGRNLLVGGGGSVTVTGGTGDNILIGGTTSYDVEPAALDALMKELARTDEDFITLLAHLLSGDGENGDTLLNPTTVQSSADKYILAGGPGNNWFFVTDGNDTIKSGTLRPGNVVTKL
jgi:Ca2+-binding RTX toxin-like protein